MDIFALIFLGYILYQIFSVATKASKKNEIKPHPMPKNFNSPPRPHPAPAGQPNIQISGSSEPHQKRPPMQTISAGQAKTFGRRQAEMRERLRAAQAAQGARRQQKPDRRPLSPRQDQMHKHAQTAKAARALLRSKNKVPTQDGDNIHDFNRSRHSDWGERAGPGLLSTQNFLIAVVFALIIYLILQLMATF